MDAGPLAFVAFVACPGAGLAEISWPRDPTGVVPLSIQRMQFADLPVGAKFRFWRRGRVLTKTGKSTYTGETGEKKQSAPDVEVRPEDDDAPPEPPERLKRDDTEVISKALDLLEAKVGRSEELTAARDALRRLSALSKLKTGH